MPSTKDLQKNMDWFYIGPLGLTVYGRGEPGGRYLTAAQRRNMPNTNVEKTVVSHVYLIRDSNPECPNIASNGAFERGDDHYGIVVMLGRMKNGSYLYDGSNPPSVYEVVDPSLAWIAKVYENQDAQDIVQRHNAPAQQNYCVHLKNPQDETAIFTRHHIENSLLPLAAREFSTELSAFWAPGANFDPASSFNSTNYQQ